MAQLTDEELKLAVKLRDHTGADINSVRDLLLSERMFKLKEREVSALEGIDVALGYIQEYLRRNST